MMTGVGRPPVLAVAAVLASVLAIPATELVRAIAFFAGPENIEELVMTFEELRLVMLAPRHLVHRDRQRCSNFSMLREGRSGLTMTDGSRNPQVPASGLGG
jgi:hypothetical protein